ncbi:DUF6980 family protein [Metabacillus litoralis]|uniref:DUF6980 family protein n=1 Tax=Metabacillus litoralis TaxID=152268 RepID=UPI003EB7C7CE
MLIPWCDSKLPESKRDLWFDTFEELGFNNFHYIHLRGTFQNEMHLTFKDH